MLNYQNYHKHSYYSNIRTSDSVVSYEQYAKKALEYGQKIISSVEHGWQGRYIECYELAKQYDLKFLFGTEAYFVKDRTQKDKTNAHVVVLAKNENGRQHINEALSEANISGFYYQPRLDSELLFSLPKNDVWITSACFTEDSIVTTDNGYKKISDIKVGERVLTHKGNYKKVESLVKKHSDELLRIKIEGCYDDILCTKDHVFPTVKRIDAGKNKNNNITWKKAESLTCLDRMIINTNKNNYCDLERLDILPFVNDFRKSKYYNKARNIIAGDSIEINDEFLTILGLYAAEGNISVRDYGVCFTLHEKETYLQNLIINFVNKLCNKNVSNIIKKRNSRGVAVYVYSKEIALVFKGLINSGCKNKNVPDFVKTLPPYKQMSFAKGVILGDGHRRIMMQRGESYNISFGTISMQLAYGVRDIFEANGIKVGCGTIPQKIGRDGIKRQKIYSMEVSSKEFYNYWLQYEISNEWFYFEWNDSSIINPARLPIHLEENEYITKGIREISKEDYSGDVYCINVEEDHSFVVDGINVHNCIAGVWKYDDYEELIKKMHEYFGDNFFLEVQAHNTVPQKNINSEILRLKEKYGIQLIAGVDSHYIDNDKAWERDDYLLSKGISYEDESGWYMDYPSPDELHNRFVEQGILNESEIEEAFNNTNIFLDVEEYKNEIFCDNLKMPSIYPDKTKEEKDAIFEKLVWDRWEEDKRSISSEQWEKYEKEIAMEIGVVKDINHSDYFLLDYEIVKDGIEHGGQITNTGRGSAVSFYINKLLGFTKVDRIVSDVKLYPERFLSKTRILQTGSIADIDLNLGNPEIFAESQKRILGENHAFPMIAYGTYKVKSAWKLFAKSQNVPFDVASEVTKQIEKFEVAIKHAETDDEREDIHVEDYIEEKYLDIFEKSKNYRGIISSVGKHACAHLIYQKNIRKNVGLIMIKGGKDEALCSLMDGKWAEKYKFLKNDLLKVSVVSLIKALYQRIGIKEHTVSELLEICTPDHKVWDIYKNGWTMGINQVEQRGTSARCAKYRPKNISELCSFVAAIRPGFKSMYQRYENREDFAYNIKTIDDLIRTPQFPQSYMLYQEHAMAILNYAGIPMDLTYEVVKNIAKKRADKVLKYKETFLKGMKERIVEQEHQTEKEAEKIANMTWQIIEDSVRYSFNASHSLSVAIDSLYCAYLKVMYPLEFYETYIKVMTEENKKDKVILAQNEASSAFGIRFSPFKFGEDNRDIRANKKKNEITNSLQTVKHFSRKVAQALWGIRGKYDYFIDLLLKIKKDKVPINSRHLDILVKLDYFEEFGNQKELLRIIEIFNDLKCGESKSISKENIKYSFMIPLLEKYGNDKGVNGNVLKAYKINDCISLLHECELYIKKCNLDDFGDCEKIKNKMEFLGYLMPTGKEQDRPKIYVSVIYPIHRRSDKKLCGHNLVGISIGSGKQSKYTIWSNVSKIKGKFKVGDILQCMGFKQNGQSFEMTDYVVVN